MTERLPLACLTCGYDLTGIGAGRCPECGREFTERDAPAMARLRAILDTGDRIPRRQLIAWALTVLIYAVGAEFMKGEDQVPALVIACVLLTLVCFGSFALGSVALYGCERTDRLAAQHAWRAELWLLHFPWLVLAPLSVLFLAISLGVMAAGGGLGHTLWAALGVAIVWLLCSLASPFIFMRRVRRRLAGTGADTVAVRLRLLIAALLVLCATMFLGLGGGLLARYGAATMAGFADPEPDGF